MYAFITFIIRPPLFNGLQGTFFPALFLRLVIRERPSRTHWTAVMASQRIPNQRVSGFEIRERVSVYMSG
ncbi:unnamed protein product [Periconia digitata]|uniref:Uncharacterized protein n=1 Tax=Periconia digitata TaxID=1303443 RepID=A0A9W4XKZ5_9PLEO|nr:unnamed protein product [Periconia digitata]